MKTLVFRALVVSIISTVIGSILLYFGNPVGDWFFWPGVVLLILVSIIWDFTDVSQPKRDLFL